jgi:hypothetical protein
LKTLLLIQAACVILSIDDTIQIGKTNPEPQMPANVPTGRQRGIIFMLLLFSFMNVFILQGEDLYVNAIIVQEKVGLTRRCSLHITE